MLLRSPRTSLSCLGFWLNFMISYFLACFSHSAWLRTRWFEFHVRHFDGSRVARNLQYITFLRSDREVQLYYVGKSRMCKLSSVCTERISFMLSAEELKSQLNFEGGALKEEFYPELGIEEDLLGRPRWNRAIALLLSHEVLIYHKYYVNYSCSIISWQLLFVP